jgi:hypothetical protein
MLHRASDFTKYYQSDKIKEDEMSRSYIVYMGEMRCYKILVGKP